MANFRAAFETKLYEVLNVETIHDVAPGGVFAGRVPQTNEPQTGPWVVYQFVSKVDDHSFNGRFATAVYLVKAISRSPWPKEAKDVDTVIDTVLEDATISPSGYRVIYCRRASDFAYAETTGGEIYQHVGGYYQIIADQT